MKWVSISIEGNALKLPWNGSEIPITVSKFSCNEISMELTV